MKEKIKTCLVEIMAQNEVRLDGTIDDDTVLLQTGLDSLGFAILVATLEEQLGFDPFVSLETAVYPKTFGDFVKIYERHQVK